MPAGGDVLLAATLVLRREVLLADDELAVADQPAARLALHAVDEGLVHRPGIDAALGALVVVDRAAVEAEGLGLAVELAGGQPAPYVFPSYRDGAAVKARCDRTLREIEAQALACTRVA